MHNNIEVLTFIPILHLLAWSMPAQLYGTMWNSWDWKANYYRIHPYNIISQIWKLIKWKRWLYVYRTVSFPFTNLWFLAVGAGLSDPARADTHGRVEEEYMYKRIVVYINIDLICKLISALRSSYWWVLSIQSIRLNIAKDLKPNKDWYDQNSTN